MHPNPLTKIASRITTNTTPGASSNTQGQTRRLLPHWKQLQPVPPAFASRTSEMRDPRPYSHGLRFLFHSDLARTKLTLHRDLHHAHAQANMSKRQPPTLQAIFLFGTFPLPKKGAGWGRGAQRARETRLIQIGSRMRY